ncbi:unnamed protein product [Blepharisma stoltei]|uniref:Uncharacterized protein n=1 Tax=Blepharisma stoltei TaxID=1481888 RepID=A0AAU9K5I3_9CILI|nr:unnamed protein product [Blepharisma stoltei]
MGQSQSCNCSQQQTPFSAEPYIDEPYINKEDVEVIHNCFEYLSPRDGVVSLNKIQDHKHEAPAYMQELIYEIEERKSDVNFDEFFDIMKPKVLEMKRLPENSVIREDTSASVFCIICPYKKNDGRNKKMLYE